MKKTTIARWESLRGKYWLEMSREYQEGFAPSYSYRGDSSGGFHGSRDMLPGGLLETDAAAIEAFSRISLANHFPGKFNRVL